MKQAPYPAPDFSLSNSEGKTVNLADFAGRWLVLYFYPKDNTPGCTTEACSLRDANDDLIDLGASVVGVSKDSAKSHQKFTEKYQLNFNLLSDPKAKTIKDYGAWGKTAFGFEGTLRKTFIINPEGQVVKTYQKVTPDGHGPQLVEDLTALLK